MKSYEKLNPIAESGVNLADKPIVFILVGLPASGKTTWAQQTFGWEIYDEHVVGSDFFVEQYARQKNKTYDQVWAKAVKESERQMNMRLKGLIKQRKLIIWDQTNLTAKKRKSILSRIPKSYKKYIVMFNTQEKTRSDRAAKRSIDQGKTIPDNIIKSMRDSFDFPDQELEGFDDIVVV